MTQWGSEMSQFQVATANHWSIVTFISSSIYNLNYNRISKGYKSQFLIILPIILFFGLTIIASSRVVTTLLHLLFLYDHSAFLWVIDPFDCISHDLGYFIEWQSFSALNERSHVLFIGNVKYSLLCVRKHSCQVKGLETHFLDLFQYFCVLFAALSDSLNLKKTCYINE